MVSRPLHKPSLTSNSYFASDVGEMTRSFAEPSIFCVVRFFHTYVAVDGKDVDGASEVDVRKQTCLSGPSENLTPSLTATIKSFSKKLVSL